MRGGAKVAPEVADDGSGPTLLLRRPSYLSLALSVVTMDERFDMRPLLVVGLLYFRESLDLGRLRTLLLERLCVLPRFAAVVVDSGHKVTFNSISQADMDMDYHVAEAPAHHGEEPWTHENLDAFLSSLNTPEHELDKRRPLWRFFYVPKMSDGRALLIPVINHAIGDGVALISALLSITDDTQMSASGPSAADAMAKPAPPPLRRTAAPSVSPARRLCAALTGCFEAVCGPVLPADPPSKLKLTDHRHPPHARVCAQSEQVDLDVIKEIKSKFNGATVNDVLLSLMTMTLRKYHDEIGEPMPARLRGIFPINLRDPRDGPPASIMGNQFGNGVFSFPHAYDDPAALVKDVKAQLDYIKVSPKPYIERALFSTVLPPLMLHGHCLRNVTRNLLLDVYGKATALLSNVPGPQSQVFLCGSPLDDLMFYSFVPLGVYIGVISYNGKVSTGVCCVPECEPDASRIAKHWKGAVKELLAASRMLPSGLGT
jgi:diacylglycerol O-acyltransferase